MENTYYEYLEQHNIGLGCTKCPFTDNCDQGGGYTEMDEHGSCPIKNIITEQDYLDAEYPENY